MQANLDAAHNILDQLKDGHGQGWRSSESESQASQSCEETGALLQNLIDELIATCKLVRVPRNTVRPKLANLDELYADELDEYIQIEIGRAHV